MVSAEPTQSLIRGRTTLIGLRIQDFVLTPAWGYSVPAIDLQSSMSALNNILIERGVINGNAGGSAPLILFDSLSSASATNNHISDLDFENPVAGAIHWRSIQNSMIMNVWGGDLAGIPKMPFIKIDKSDATNSQPARRLTLMGIEVDFGTVSNPSLFFDGDKPGQGMITVIGSRLPVVSNNGPGANQITTLHSDINSVVGDPLDVIR